MRMKATFLAAAAAFTLTAGAASAQTGAAPAAAAAAPNVTAGAKVTDASGGAVGTVASVTNGVAVVDTGVAKVGVPVGSFAARADGVAIAMTKTELEAAASGAKAQSAADFKASLVAGAEVTGPEGNPVGKLGAVDAQYAEVDTGSVKAKLPLSAFAKGENGVVVSMTKAQIEAAAGAAGAKASEPAASEDAATDTTAPKK